MDKAALRRHLRGLRRAIPKAVRSELHRRIGHHLTSVLAPFSGPIGLYAPQRFEASPLEASLPNPLAWPRIVSLDPPRLAFHVARVDELSHGSARETVAGLREPAPDLPSVAAADLAALVLPGLGFDDTLHRLGQGGGFYDATLAALPAKRPLLIGLAYACQRVPEVPREAHDHPVDLLVTEDGIHYPAGRSTAR